VPLFFNKLITRIIVVFGTFLNFQVRLYLLQGSSHTLFRCVNAGGGTIIGINVGKEKIFDLIQLGGTYGHWFGHDEPRQTRTGSKKKNKGSS